MTVRHVTVAAAVTACLAIISFVGLSPNGIVVEAQLAWTSIYVDGTSQVDLWTSSSQGCQCSWESDDAEDNKADLSCACCVKDGGCHCGTASPNRCMQCGLEEHCNNMCNMTIDSMTLLKQSGKTFGQIKSRVLEGPGLCWYSFVPSAGQRVEIQLYRLVSIGRFNGTSCEGGALRVYMGGSSGDRRAIDETVRSPATFEMCGVNERYAPPVVLFSDGEEATTLVFGVEEKTLRSQFLAYFSFTAATAGPQQQQQQQQQLAFQPYGGTRLHNTVCDWLYQDFSCRKHPERPCVMASPGYPGLYPSNRICNFYITTSSVATRVRLSIRSLLLPHGRCNTDYLAVYQGSTRATAQHLHTFCGTNAVTSQSGNGRKARDQTAHYEYSGPNLLIEFGSGSARPPFNYNGFLIELHFVEQAEGEDGESTPTVEVLPPLEPSPQSSLPVHRTSSGSTSRGNCNVIIRANETQSGHFDTRSHDWSQICRFTFIGRPTDVVHVSLFNYKLRSRSCNTVIEVWDGMAPHDLSSSGKRQKQSNTRKPIHKICSPQTRHARDRGGSFLEHQTFVSSGSTMTLIVKRTAAAAAAVAVQGGQSESELEFVDGAYLFHDERTSGTLQPSTMCEVSFYGLSSQPSGNVTNPGGEHLYWNVEGELRCSQHFIPAANQSVTISVRSVGSSTALSLTSSNSQASPLLNELVPPFASAACETRCGDGGCECATDPRSRRPHDKLEIFADHGKTSLVCLCGDRFDPFMLPVTVRSWTQVTLVYTVATYSWNTKGFDYAASYEFGVDTTCGVNTIMKQSGEIYSNEPTEQMSLDSTVSAQIDRPNNFYHQSCVWILDSNVERQLFVELSSNQSRPCSAWNISLHEFSPSASDVGNAGVGELLHTFCPRDKHKSYSLPWKLNTVVVRLRLMSRTPAQYRIKWRSQVVRANTRLANPTPAPNAASSAPRQAVHATVQFAMLFTILFASAISACL